LLISKESKIRNQILLAIEIASKCGQAIAFKDINLLLNQPNQKTIRQIVQHDPQISKSVSIEKNYAVIKGYESLFQKRKEREKTSKKFQEKAASFASQLLKIDSNWRLIAVCGSTAYGSAKNTDDIDLLLTTKKNKMWQSFFKALLLARIFSLKAEINRQKTNFCLSYVKDEKSFEDEITQHKTPLIARELLSIQVLYGENYYKSLLTKSNWIAKLFPNLYKIKLHPKEKIITINANQNDNGVLNLFIYATLKKYLLLKALIKNLKYRKQHKKNHLFVTKITQGACVYTSKRYQELEKIYNSNIF